MRRDNKISSEVDFPSINFHLKAFESKIEGNDQTAVYNLVAVSNHFGGLTSGHYTATVLDLDTRRMLDKNDTRVSEVNRYDYGAAYILFYESKC